MVKIHNGWKFNKRLNRWRKTFANGEVVIHGNSDLTISFSWGKNESFESSRQRTKKIILTEEQAMAMIDDKVLELQCPPNTIAST